MRNGPGIPVSLPLTWMLGPSESQAKPSAAISQNRVVDSRWDDPANTPTTARINRVRPK